MHCVFHIPKGRQLGPLVTVDARWLSACHKMAFVAFNEAAVPEIARESAH
jgi:hypothetical protein